MSSSKANSQRLVAIVAVVVVILLAINAFLLYNKIQQDKKIESQQVEIDEADKLKQELEKQYHEALSDLEEMRGTNEEMDALIDQQKMELSDARVRIEKLIRNEKNLKKARAEINGMTAQLEEYIAEIETLKNENESLRGDKAKLTKRSRSLEADLEGQKQANIELEGQRDQLSSEKDQLSAERSRLAKTVNQASVVSVKNVAVTGLKMRSSGKAVKKKYAKNIDQLKVCFETTSNEITKPGLERFYVRIITPIGETLAVEALGSGKIINKKTGDEVLFTQVKEYEYENDETELCFTWEPNVPFQNGNYLVEIYNKGHLAGESSFMLK